MLTMAVHDEAIAIVSLAGGALFTTADVDYPEFPVRIR